MFTSTRVAAIIVVCLFILSCIPILIKHHTLVHDPWIINDDQRAQIFEFYYEDGERIFKGDYIADYYDQAFFPSGFSLLYSVAGFIGDPLVFSRYLQEFLFLVFLAFLFLIGKDHNNFLVGMLCLLCGFLSVHYIGRFAGGLPRAFSFTLIAGFCWGLIRGNLWIIIPTLLLQVFFYPPSALPCCIAFAVWLLFPQLTGRDTKKYTVKKRIFILALVGMLSFISVLPHIVSFHSYGDRITHQNMHDYPEIGQNGRYRNNPYFIPPFPSLTKQVARTAKISFSGNGLLDISDRGKNVLLVLASVVSLIGWSFLIYRRDKACALLILLASGGLGYQLAVWLWPYLFIPQRSILYALPVALHTGLVFGSIEFFKNVFRKIRLSKPDTAIAIASLSLFILMTAFLVDKNLPVIGLRSEHEKAPFYNYLKYNLPQTALLAGFPEDVDSIPLLSKKRILAGKETYLVHYTEYVSEMRRRTIAVIDAFFSDNIQAVKRLRDEFRVTHLIFNWKYYKPVYDENGHYAGIYIPDFFAPHDTYLKTLVMDVPLEKRAILRIADDIEKMRIGSISILDLSKLPG